MRTTKNCGRIVCRCMQVERKEGAKLIDALPTRLRARDSPSPRHLPASLSRPPTPQPLLRIHYTGEPERSRCPATASTAHSSSSPISTSTAARS